MTTPESENRQSAEHSTLSGHSDSVSQWIILCVLVFLISMIFGVIAGMIHGSTFVDAMIYMTPRSLAVAIVALVVEVVVWAVRRYR